MSSASDLLHIEHAYRWHQRFVGLMFRRSMPPGHALLLSPCGSVHTAFMRFTIDVVYLDAQWHVLAVRAQMPPWRMSWGPRGTRHTLELAGGTVAQLGWQFNDEMEALLIIKQSYETGPTARSKGLQQKKARR